MPKPPTFDPRKVDDIYQAKSPRDRVQALLRLAPSGVVPFELVIDLAVVAGSRCFRDGYEGTYPSGYVGFSGAVDLAGLQPEGDRGLALLQGVAGAAAEGLHAAPNFAGFPWSHSLSHEATLDDMDRSIGEQALPKFHGRLVPFLNEETRRKYGHRYLFTRSVIDFENGGQRHILTGRGLRLADALKWRNSEECLYALSHYFLHAPTDYREAEELQAWLEGLGKDLPGDNRNRKPALPAEEAAALEAALTAESGKPLFDRLLAAWMKGYSLEALAEVLLFLAGAHLAAGGAGGASEAAARAVLFTDASFAAFPWLRGHDGLVQVLMCALFVRRLGAPVRAAAAATASGVGAEDLPAALASGDRERATEVAQAAAAREPESTPSVLAAHAAARDTTAAAAGFLGLAPVLIAAFRRSASPRKPEHLAALAGWLSRPASRELASAWRSRA